MVPLPSADLLEQKRALRSEMRAGREALSADERRARAEAASARLLGLPEVGLVGGKVVAGYVAVRGEMDPAAALAGLAVRGATIVLPRVPRAGSKLEFLRVDPGAELRPGAHGIPEPASSLLHVVPAALDLVIVPGLAFDAGGARVGSGAGYYDRTFATARPATQRLVGLAYDFQIVERCPAEAHDLPVDIVVTETRVLRRPRRGGPR
jgi:5-formyltetrahydrofolate cyclo-ligase